MKLFAASRLWTTWVIIGTCIIILLILFLSWINKYQEGVDYYNYEKLSNHQQLTAGAFGTLSVDDGTTQTVTTKCSVPLKLIYDRVHGVVIENDNWTWIQNELAPITNGIWFDSNNDLTSYDYTGNRKTQVAGKSPKLIWENGWRNGGNFKHAYAYEGGTTAALNDYADCLKKEIESKYNNDLENSLNDIEPSVQSQVKDQFKGKLQSNIDYLKKEAQNQKTDANNLVYHDNFLLKTLKLTNDSIAYVNERKNEYKNDPNLGTSLKESCDSKDNGISNLFLNDMYGNRITNKKVEVWNSIDFRNITNAPTYQSEVVQWINSEITDRCEKLSTKSDSLKGKIDEYHNVCKSAKNFAIDAGDNIDDGVRKDMVTVIQSKIDSTDTKINQIKTNAWLADTADNAQNIYDTAFTAAENTNKECKDLQNMYEAWDVELGQIAEKPCKPEPNIQLPGVTEIINSAQQNATSLGDILSNLQARVDAIEAEINTNEVTIGNSKYSELIIDVTDPQTFDYSLTSTLPVVSVVGSKPQKLKFILPRGKDGPGGLPGDPGGDYKGGIKQSLRGPRGDSSHYSGLPEQWY